MKPTVPDHPDALTPAWLTRSLRNAYPGIEVRGARVERIGEGFGLASEVFRVRLETAPTSAPTPVATPAPTDGVPPSVVVKLWSTRDAGGREGDVLDRLNAANVPGVPRVIAHAVDARRARGVLVLDDVRGARQGDCLVRAERADAIALARLLGGVHGAFWNDASLAAAASLPDVRRFGREAAWFASRGARFRERFAARAAGWRSLLARAEALVAHADAVLGEATPTLVHHDLHLDNVVFEASDAPVLLDWARAARGPGVLDLVELVVHVAHRGDRDDVVAAYLDELEARGIAVSRVTLDRQLAAAFGRAFVTGTYGIARWEPTDPRGRAIIEVHLDRLNEAVTWFEM